MEKSQFPGEFLSKRAPLGAYGSALAIVSRDSTSSVERQGLGKVSPKTATSSDRRRSRRIRVDGIDCPCVAWTSPMKCPQCGAVSPDGKKFCGDCGASLSENAAP